MNYRTKCFHYREKKCAECGSEENIEVHHVDGNRTNNSIENLAPLCHSCHVKIHTDDPDMDHWIEKLDPTPYFGELTEDKVNQAFENADLSF